MADMLAQMWMWIADAFDDRPFAAVLCAAIVAALIAVVVVMVGP